MSEAPSDPRPSGQKEAAWDAVSETELEDALTTASSLAADLSEQLAAPDEPAPLGEPNPLATDRESLDHELSQLAERVSAVSKEVEGSAPASAATGAPVPNFMAEFMSPPGETTADAAPATIADEAAASPGDVPPPSAPAGPETGVVGGRIHIALPATRRLGDQKAETADAAADVPDSDAAGEQVSMGLLGLVAAVLNAVDGPFAWAGRRTRAAAGWLAIVVLAAAAIIYLAA